MEFFAEIKNRKIIPLYDSDNEEVQKLKANKEYKFKVTSPRNYKFHKKFFALINLGFQNSDNKMNFDGFRAYVIMQAGYYERHVTPKGGFYTPKSINFASMDETEFEKLYSASINVIIKIIGCTTEDIEAELINFF